MCNPFSLLYAFSKTSNKNNNSRAIIINEAKLICLLSPRELRFLLPHAVWHTHQPVVIHYISYINICVRGHWAHFAVRDIILFEWSGEKKTEEKLTWVYERSILAHSLNILKNVCTLRRLNLYSAAHKHNQHNRLWKLIWKADSIKVLLTHTLNVKKKTSVRFYRCNLSPRTEEREIRQTNRTRRQKLNETSKKIFIHRKQLSVHS